MIKTAGRNGWRPARISGRELIRGAGAQAVIFDMDGVLADTEEFHQESWRILTERRFGVAAPPELISKTFGQTNENIIPLLYPPGEELDRAEIPGLSVEKEIYYRQAARGRVKPLAGVERFLSWLEGRGIPMAIGTSAPPENTRFLLSQFGWEGRFGAVVDRTGFRASKPWPDCFLEAAARLRVSPRRCIVFEDSLHGILAARRAGSMPAAVLTTLPGEVLLLQARWCFRDFMEIAC